jgi:hypothetical protein
MSLATAILESEREGEVLILTVLVACFEAV